MLKKLFCCILIAVTVISAFSACKNSIQPESSNEMYTFTDNTGHTVTVKYTPENTAVLFSSFADIWALSGGKTAITVGEAVERGFADSNAVLVDKSAGKSIDSEKLIAAAPDLVILSADIAAQSETAEMLRSAGIPCAEMHIECFEDYLSALKIFTDINKNSEAYEKYGLKQEEAIKELLKKIPQHEQQKRILFIRSGAGESSAKAKTASDHFAAAMLDELGVYNIADSAPILLDGLSTEEIIKQDPDIIFVATMGDPEAAKAYMDTVLLSPAWQSLKAIKNGNYYYLPKDKFQFKPNAKWFEAYEYLAKLLYPETDLK